jgi:hypothetical protein
VPFDDLKINVPSAHQAVFERDVGAGVAADQGEGLVQDAPPHVGLTGGLDDELKGFR